MDIQKSKFNINLDIIHLCIVVEVIKMLLKVEYYQVLCKGTVNILILILVHFH